MAVTPTIIPLSLVKSLAKGLHRAGRKGSKLSSLTASQEALAKAMKYSDWEDLSRSYDTLSSWSTTAALKSWLERVLDCGGNHLTMKVSPERTLFVMESRDGVVHLGDEKSETGMMIAKVFFNVLNEDPAREVVFSPDSPQKGFARIGMARGEVQLEAVSMPSSEDRFSITFIPVEIGRGIYLPRFFSHKDISTLMWMAQASTPTVLEARSSFEACALAEALATLATPLRPVVVITPHFLPRLPTSSPVRIVRLKGGADSLDATLDNLPPLSPKTLLVADVMGQDPGVLSRHRKLFSRGAVLIAQKFEGEEGDNFCAALGISSTKKELVDFNPMGHEGEGISND